MTDRLHPRTSPRVWQCMILVWLAGLLVLNYGFANLAVHVGSIPLPVGSLLGFAALGLCVIQERAALRGLQRDPIALLLIGLILYGAIRLALGLPEHGALALRDSSILIEAAFFFVGLVWARGQDRDSLLKGLIIILGMILLYTFAYPFRESIREMSPKTGLFRSVPIFGTYSEAYLHLIWGAALCWILPRSTLPIKDQLAFVLSAAQAGWSMIFQMRTGYLALPAAFLFACIFIGRRKAWEMAGSFIVGIIFFFAITTILPAKGRLGPTSLEFTAEHAASLTGKRSAPGAGNISFRKRLYREAWEHWTQDATTVVLGDGFGRPIVRMLGNKSVPVRHPHNSHLTILVRTGLVGFLAWITLHILITLLLVRAARRARTDSSRYGIHLALLLFYAFGMGVACIQTPLEFTHTAVPFYLVTGYAVGLARMELTRRGPTDGTESPRAA